MLTNATATQAYEQYVSGAAGAAPYFEDPELSRAQLAIARLLFGPGGFGRRFDPDDPQLAADLAARPSVRDACTAAGVRPGDWIAWPSRETIAARLGRCVRRLRLDALTEGPDPLFEVHPLRWRRPGRPGRLFVWRAAAAGTECPPIARARVGGHGVLNHSSDVLKPPSEMSDVPLSRAAFEVKSLLPEQEKREKRARLRLVSSGTATKEEAEPSTPAAVSSPVDAVVDAYITAWSERFGPGGFADERDRNAIRQLLARPGMDAATAAAMLETYLNSAVPYWHGRGFPLQGLAVDWLVWSVAARGAAPMHSTRRHGELVYQKSSDMDDVKPLDPERSRAVAAAAVECAVAAVVKEHDRGRHVGRLEYCGRCARQLADIDRGLDSRASGSTS